MKLFAWLVGIGSACYFLYAGWFSADGQDYQRVAGAVFLLLTIITVQLEFLDLHISTLVLQNRRREEAAERLACIFKKQIEQE